MQDEEPKQAGVPPALGDLLSTIKELKSWLSFDEEGGMVETYVAGRYYAAPLSHEVNDCLTRLLALANKLEVTNEKK